MPTPAPIRFDGDRFSNAVLLAETPGFAGRFRSADADLLVRIAQIDLRKLYLEAGYPTISAYCIEALRLSDDEAWKRIQAARAAYRYPALFEALAESRLNLTGICLLAPHLTPENGNELISEATHRSKAQIQRMLAERFPEPETLDVFPAVSPVPEPRALSQVGQAGGSSSVGSLVPAQVKRHTPAASATPIGGRKFRVEFTIDESEHDLLQQAQDLLSHRHPSADVRQVFLLALKSYVAVLEKKKFGATVRPRIPRSVSARSRHIPLHIRRAVWLRDGGQCTFVSKDGHRCSARRFLEFDHVDPVARGGKPILNRMRLRCRGHNQYEAERTFGAQFMKKKREEAARARNGRNGSHGAGGDQAESNEPDPGLLSKRRPGSPRLSP